MNEEVKFYFCYNSRFADELKVKGFKAITTAINPKYKIHFGYISEQMNLKTH